MSRFCFCNCPAGFSAPPDRHAPDCPGRSGAGKAPTPVPATVDFQAGMEACAKSQVDAQPVYMVRTHGSSCWEEVSGESLELCQADPAEYEVRKLYTHADAGEVIKLRSDLGHARRQYQEMLDQAVARMGERDTLRALLAMPVEIGRLINSQDNRHTDQPLFAVLEKRAMVTLDTHDHDRIEWYHADDATTADERTARRLEALHAVGREVKGWERYAVKDIDVFVTTCFTEQGCIDFLARDGHNHTKPFIYAFGSHRNAEYQSLRNWLKSLPTTQESEVQP